METEENKVHWKVTENEFANEHTLALLVMQMHDILQIDSLFSESLVILRVFGGYLYKRGTQMPVFVPEPKNIKELLKQFEDYNAKKALIN
jgi:hypothetical protein